MGQPFVGEIRMFGGNFAPSGWSFCSGQLLPISENETLFNLIGTTYGGDGQSTFQLPDLRGRVPVHMGTGSGQNYLLGETGGNEGVTLNVNQIPIHNHVLAASNINQQLSPNNGMPAAAVSSEPGVQIYSAGPATVTLNNASIAQTGGNQPHNNLQPFLCVSFIISLFGIFPSQT